MKYYVAGLMFNNEMDKICLIKKNRPDWQRGLLNGIGGKMEHGELPIEAMVREFKEETGVEVIQRDWVRVLDLHFDYAIVYFFACRSSYYHSIARSNTDEEVKTVLTSNILNGSISKVINNIPMIVTLSMMRLTDTEGGQP